MATISAMVSDPINEKGALLIVILGSTTTSAGQWLVVGVVAVSWLLLKPAPVLPPAPLCRFCGPAF
jgi:hypothetical protein